ncbi:hypothetical protein [Pseudarthrobacter sp. ATCC 49987]|uniref:hypothetical protein n=1 Tax=Pseudarthrobacter sp. ATCC 49987 TaxID=2698204 RepID=UPI00136F8E96|nr:hypothetical protein [Pseudarthrobacter sp. ATCC 49987]
MINPKLAKRLATISLTLAMVAGGSVLAAAPAQAITGPGWTRAWTTPQSYCIKVMGQYAAKGYLTTGCTYYGTSASGGGYFDYHR